MATKKTTPTKAAPKKSAVKSAVAKTKAAVAKTPLKATPAKKKPEAKESTAKKVTPLKKTVAKLTPRAKTAAAKKTPAKTPAKTPVAKKPVVKAPAKTPVAKKPVAKAPAKKPVVKQPEVKAPAKKPEAKSPAKKPTKPVTKKPETKAVNQKPTPEVVTEAPKGTGVRTPTVVPTTIGKTQSALKPNYTLLRPKNDGKKQGSVRQATRAAFKDSDLEEFKRRLLEEREKKVKLQNAMSSDALSRPDEENVEEDGTNSSNRADLLQRAEETRKSLRAIDDALRAIENKTYGICSVCKCAISRERLRAAPFAIRCVKCKEEWERQMKAAKRSANL